MKILTATETRKAEQIAFNKGVSGETLMENAGLAATEIIKQKFNVKEKNVVVVVGQGNNGGDGYVVARELKKIGAIVTVITAMGKPKTPDSTTMQSDCSGRLYIYLTLYNLPSGLIDNLQKSFHLTT